MGDYDDEEDGFQVKMIPKPGAQPAVGGPVGRPGENVGNPLGNSMRDKQMAQSSWDSMMDGIRHTVQEVPQEAIKKVDNYLNPRTPQPQSTMPTSSGMSSADLNQGQDLYDRIMQERMRMLEQGVNPEAPENMQRFQKIRDSLVKKGGS